uniref:Uncharacterized protein n=1 Tax=Ralstonia solanacearum TaxID=305 RepID=A0A0S4WT31_RALSL|nr:conserved protein of unknown function [Ralstonia solanacearum]
MAASAAAPSTLATPSSGTNLPQRTRRMPDERYRCDEYPSSLLGLFVSLSIFRPQFCYMLLFTQYNGVRQLLMLRTPHYYLRVQRRRSPG